MAPPCPRRLARQRAHPTSSSSCSMLNPGLQEESRRALWRCAASLLWQRASKTTSDRLQTHDFNAECASESAAAEYDWNQAIAAAASLTE